MQRRIFTARARRLAAALILLLCAAALAACNSGLPQVIKDPPAPAVAPDPADDLRYVQEKGVLTVGVTEYMPLDFRIGREWTGFDAELATRFAEQIGVEVSFVQINWDKKAELLASGAIDCVWNGMTRTAELEQSIGCSRNYLASTEVIVLPKDQFDRYDTAEKSYHLLFAVENGSTAQAIATERRLRTVPYTNQQEVLNAVKSRYCDAAIADDIYARYMTAAGREFDSLKFGFPFSAEVICIGLRRDSVLIEKVNEFLDDGFASGFIQETAERYGLQGALIVD